MTETDFPRHSCGLYLTHNEHKDVYESVENFVVDRGDDDCWIGDAEREEAIATNELWRLQWYPDTPIGFYVVLAASFTRLLAHARNIQKEADESTVKREV